MAEWKPVGADKMLVDGNMTEILINDRRVLLARVQGTYYAVQGACTHLGGTLAGGKLTGFVVQCPRHRSQFDVRDGHVVAWITGITGVAHTVAETVKRPRPLQSYRTRVQDGQVWVEIAS
jgi:nitrite reductase/ring-hydroxylating ferredoxin subunit